MKSYDTYYSEDLDVEIYYVIEYDSGTRYDSDGGGTPSSFDMDILRVTRNGKDVWKELTTDEWSELNKEVEHHIDEHVLEYMYEDEDHDADDKCDEMRMDEYDSNNERD
jgi:hypothetical protein